MIGLVSILFEFISCIFFSLKNYVSICLKLARKKPDSSSISLHTSFFYRSFFGFSRYLLIHSLIHRAKFLISLFARLKLNTYLIHRSSFAIGTSSIPFNLSRICSLNLLIYPRSIKILDSIYTRGSTRFYSN